MSATEYLPMLDEHGSRARIIPAEVKGVLRNWRTSVHSVLLVVLLTLPWVRINGFQALRLDIAGRRFEIFGMLFLSHDAPLLFLLVMLMIIVLAIVTALWGRVWCGWTCPQTVFIDAVYRRIEILIEGNYIKRRKLAAQPLCFDKACKLFSKWLLYFAVSFLFAHSLMAYFAGGRELLKMMNRPPGENWTYFLFASGITGLLMFNFGWFREQFCVIMCPYGRFQSVLMDKNTITVMYDELRGEPRKGLVSSAKQGDCVSCNRCVEVCPTKIDIRNGIQMECISCTACVDACNEIMRKVKKPEGLIRHGKISPGFTLMLRPRILAYLSLAVLILITLVFLVGSRKTYSMMVLRAAGSPYEALPGDRILNHFKNHYLNQSVSEQEVEFRLSKEDRERGIDLAQAKRTFVVSAGGSVEPHFFISFPKALLSTKGEINFELWVHDKKSDRKESVDVQGLGPYSGGS